MTLELGQVELYEMCCISGVPPYKRSLPCFAGDCAPGSGADATTGCLCQSALETVNIIIGIAIDESGSILQSAFSTAKTNVANFIQTFDANNPTASFYVNKFDDTVEQVAAVSNDGAAVAAAVRGMVQGRGSTAIGSAIADLEAKMDGPCSAVNTFCLGIVITDGENNTGANPLTTSASFKTNVGKLAVLGVGPGTNTGLNAQYASPGLSFTATNFGELDNVLNELLQDICPLQQGVTAAASVA